MTTTYTAELAPVKGARAYRQTKTRYETIVTKGDPTGAACEKAALLTKQTGIAFGVVRIY